MILDQTRQLWSTREVWKALSELDSRMAKDFHQAITTYLESRLPHGREMFFITPFGKTEVVWLHLHLPSVYLEEQGVKVQLKGACIKCNSNLSKRVRRVLGTTSYGEFGVYWQYVSHLNIEDQDLYGASLWMPYQGWKDLPREMFDQESPSEQGRREAFYEASAQEVASRLGPILKGAEYKYFDGAVSIVSTVVSNITQFVARFMQDERD